MFKGTFFYTFEDYIKICGCQLVLRASKSVGAGDDVQNFGRCQAPVAPVLTQALICTCVLYIC